MPVTLTARISLMETLARRRRGSRASTAALRGEGRHALTRYRFIATPPQLVISSQDSTTGRQGARPRLATEMSLKTGLNASLIWGCFSDPVEARQGVGLGGWGRRLGGFWTAMMLSPPRLGGCKFRCGRSGRSGRAGKWG